MEDFPNVDYEILKPDQVLKLMDEEIGKVETLLDLPKNKIRFLLSKEMWNVNFFLEKYYDGRIALNENILPKPQNSQSLSKEIDDNGKENKPSVPQVRMTRKRKLEESNQEEQIKKPKKASRASVSTKKLQKIACEICFEDCNSMDIVVVDLCNHSFCKACLKQYLLTSLDNSSAMDCIACAGFKCQCLFSDESVMQLLDKKMQAKYQQLISRSFVQNNRYLRWCIAPNCHNAIKISDIASESAGVTCDCGIHEFCFKCAQEVHDLIPCKIMKSWSEIKAANLETATYIANYTKQCTKCFTEIEKNGGCNHMTCKNCHFEFCWICLKSWSQHQFCTATESKGIKTSNMRRLVDCNTKFATMTQSIKLDTNMYKSQLKKQDLEIKEQWFKINFVKDAVEVLLRARRSLADSFIFTYFFHGNDNDIQWIRFSINQNELLKATEDLSHILETQVNGDNYHTMKLQLKDSVNYVSGCHRAMFEHVVEGFQHDMWTLKDE